MLAAVTCAAAFMLGLNSPAGADYVFNGSGTSGAPVSPAETNNFDGRAAATGFRDNWGSPGVFAGSVS
jgi:hypothetical protein